MDWHWVGSSIGLLTNLTIASCYIRVITQSTMPNVFDLFTILAWPSLTLDVLSTNSWTNDLMLGLWCETLFCSLWCNSIGHHYYHAKSVQKKMTYFPSWRTLIDFFLFEQDRFIPCIEFARHTVALASRKIFVNWEIVICFKSILMKFWLKMHVQIHSFIFPTLFSKCGYFDSRSWVWLKQYSLNQIRTTLA